MLMSFEGSPSWQTARRLDASKTPKNHLNFLLHQSAAAPTQAHAMAWTCDSGAALALQSAEPAELLPLVGEGPNYVDSGCIGKHRINGIMNHNMFW